MSCEELPYHCDHHGMQGNQHWSQQAVQQCPRYVSGYNVFENSRSFIVLMYVCTRLQSCRAGSIFTCKCAHACPTPIQCHPIDANRSDRRTRSHPAFPLRSTPHMQAICTHMRKTEISQYQMPDLQTPDTPYVQCKYSITASARPGASDASPTPNRVQKKADGREQCSC